MLEGDSEPDNYEGDFSKDQAAFHEEQDVRRTVFVEMSKRSSTFTKNDKGEIIETVPGIWSDFDFDFSRAPIFYSLSSLTIEKGNFSSAKFYSNTAFIWATFTQTADFIWATFTQNAEFTGAKFTQNANFTGAKFTQTADFTGAKFTQNANFSGATLTQNAEFTGAKFTQNANFTGAKFTQNADFYVTAFTQNADFTWATFTQNANFSNTEFAGAAEFDNAKFTENATFRGAKFIGKTSFEEAYFEKYAPTFADDTGPTQFSAQVDPQDYLFKVHPESPHGFSCGNAKLLNRTFILPRGAILFNPDSWDEEKQEYTRISEPAK